ATPRPRTPLLRRDRGLRSLRRGLEVLEPGRAHPRRRLLPAQLLERRTVQAGARLQLEPLLVLGRGDAVDLRDVTAEVAENLAAEMTLRALAVVGQHAEATVDRGLPKVFAHHPMFSHIFSLERQALMMPHPPPGDPTPIHSN